MSKYDYNEGKFPYPNDVNVMLPNGVNAFVGKHTYGIELIKLHLWGSKKSYSIGRFSSIAHTQFFLAGNHPTHFYAQGLFLPKYFSNSEAIEGNIDHDFISNGNINIGNDVWVGNFSTIMSGVNVGDGAVIAANAHVVRDVQPYSIVGGNPAKHIKFRFPENIIQKLLILKWWELEDEIINIILGNLRIKVSLAHLEQIIELCQECKRTKAITI